MDRDPFANRATLSDAAITLAAVEGMILWLVADEDKREPLSRLLSGDTAIPAGRVEAGASLVLADAAAAGPGADA